MAFQAINPDVSKSELSITNTSDIKIAGGDQVTMSCWAKFSSLNNTGIMMQGGGSGTSGKWLRVNNGMFDVLYNYDNGGSSSTCGWQSFCSPAIIETGKWYHLAYTLDANKRITLYVNGVKYIPTGTFFTFTGSKPGENILHSTWANC